MDAPLLGLFASIGVFNAWVVSGVLIFRKDLRREPSLVRLALFLAAVGFLLAVFTVWYLGWLGYSVGVRVVHDGLGLALGPLFLDHVRCVVRGSSLRPLWYLPVAVYFVLVLLVGSPWVQWVAIEHLVLVQLLYTVCATQIYVQARLTEQRPNKEILFLLTAMWILHLAQLTRILVPDSQLIFEAVPVVGAVILIGMNVYILSDSRVLRRITKRPPFSGTPITLEQLQTYVERHKSYLDPNVTLEQLARGLKVSSKHLSWLINSNSTGGFYGLVNKYRVDEAKGLLRSTEERQTSVEAIGMMAGFKSRSTFYAAFKKVTGCTPARYREINHT